MLRCSDRAQPPWIERPQIYVAQGTSLFVYLFLSLFVAQVNFTYTFTLKKEVPDQHIYTHAPHNSKCGTNRTQAHPHHTKQCTFCTHFAFALTISTYTPIWAQFLDPLHKKVPDQHIYMNPTVPSVVPIEPRHIPTIQNSALFALLSHSHSP